MSDLKGSRSYPQMLRSQVPWADLHALGCLLMDQIQMTRTLLDQGYDYDDLRRLERRGELFRVRRGRGDNPVKTVGGSTER